MLINALSAQVLCIDVQEKLLAAMLGRDELLKNAERICAAATHLGVPVTATEQSPEKLGRTDLCLRKYIQNTVPKLAFGAVDEVLLDVLLPEPGSGQNQHGQQNQYKGASGKSVPKHLRKPEPDEERDNIVLFGAEAHICVLQTAIQLLEQDLIVWVVTDACASRSLANRDAAFDRLAANGCELITTEMFVFELLRSAEHTKFKQVQALIK
jgi:nicotinamidase-related amidase